MLCIDKMSGLNDLGKSEIVVGGCLYSDCNLCPSNENSCPDLMLGRGVKTKKLVSGLGESIKETFSIDKGDGL